jgi:predicted nucleic acid-binding protein
MNQKLDAETKKEFLNLTNKNISYVDLNTALIAKKYKIKTVLTFNKHFKALGKKYGFKVIGC